MHIADALQVDGRTSLLLSIIRQTALEADHHVLTIKWGGHEEQEARKYANVLTLGLNEPLRHLRHRLQTLRSLAGIRPDLCICWAGSASFASVLMKPFGTPIVWTLHNTIERWTSFRDRFLVRVLAWLSKFVPSTVVCCTEEVHRIHRDIHGYPAEKLVVFQNAVDTSRFKPSKEARIRVRASLDVGPAQILVAVPSRMEVGATRSQGDFKDIGNLVQSIRKAVQMEPTLRVLLFGSNMDPGNKELTALLIEAEVDEHFSLLGVRKDVPDLLAACDIYVLSSSRGEGLPIALLEAISVGLTPVCTDSGGIRDVIESDGFVVPPKDSSALAEAIVAAAKEDPDVRELRSRVLRQKAKSLYSVERLANQYLELCDR